MRRVFASYKLFPWWPSAKRGWVCLSPSFLFGCMLTVVTFSRSKLYRDQPMLQHGILRVNCVDCLDRTNAAQFAIAKRAFGHQLYALGLLATPHLPFLCDAVDVLTEVRHSFLRHILS